MLEIYKQEKHELLSAIVCVYCAQYDYSKDAAMLCMHGIR